MQIYCGSDFTLKQKSDQYKNSGLPKYNFTRTRDGRKRSGSQNRGISYAAVDKKYSRSFYGFTCLYLSIYS